MYGICVNEVVQKQYAVTLSVRHEYKLFYDPGIVKLDEIPCICKNINKPVAKRILPTSSNTAKLIVYKNCIKTMLAASHRQAKSMPAMDPVIRDAWYEFCNDIFNNEIVPILYNFKYSYNHWFNHLTSKQQREILGIDISQLDKYVYSNFPKVELQIDDSAKARNISAPNAEVKFVMGPVIWQLEYLFSKKFHGYCGGKTYQEMADYYQNCYEKGFDLSAQGDGSGFDLSQLHECKYIDRLIYNYLVDNNYITHVDSEIFRSVSCRRYRKLMLTALIDGVHKQLGYMTLDATVGSGSPDTTFGNTLRMAMYNRFVLEQILKLTKDDYGLLCKGDDFVLLISKYYYNQLESAYYKFFLKAEEFDEVRDNNKPIKGAQILKFLLIGDYESIDFCSTNVIHRNNTIVVIRKVDRLVSLGHWSVKALQYSKPELALYYKALADCNKAWANNLFFFEGYTRVYQKYHDVLYKTLDAKELKMYKNFFRKGEVKITLPVVEKYRDDDSQDYKFGRDLGIALKERKQFNTVGDSYVNDFLIDKYKITKDVAILHIDKLLNCDEHLLYDNVSGQIM